MPRAAARSRRSAFRSSGRTSIPFPNLSRRSSLLRISRRSSRRTARRPRDSSAKRSPKGCSSLACGVRSRPPSERAFSSRAISTPFPASREGADRVTCARSGSRSRSVSAGSPPSSETTTRSARGTATSRVSRTPGLHVLDGEVRELDGLHVGGVRGIMGNPSRLNRQAPETFIEKIEVALDGRSNVLLLHEGPDAVDGSGKALRGSADIRIALERAGPRKPPLVVCGHSWWPVPLVELAEGVQVLKVDGRVVVLERAD